MENIIIIIIITKRRCESQTNISHNENKLSFVASAVYNTRRKRWHAGGGGEELLILLKTAARKRRLFFFNFSYRVAVPPRMSRRHWITLQSAFFLEYRYFILRNYCLLRSTAETLNTQHTHSLEKERQGVWERQRKF